MFIDKYKQEDGTYLYNECTHERAQDLILRGMLGFCGCGMPVDCISFIKGGLELLDKYSKEETDFKQWKEEVLKYFGTEGGEWFFWYWCDKEELSNHGGIVPGWLEEKGIELLSDLRESEREGKDE